MAKLRPEIRGLVAACAANVAAARRDAAAAVAAAETRAARRASALEDLVREQAEALAELADAVLGRGNTGADACQ